MIVNIKNENKWENMYKFYKLYNLYELYKVSVLTDKVISGKSLISSDSSPIQPWKISSSTGGFPCFREYKDIFML
jgi:hypothetical protein